MAIKSLYFGVFRRINYKNWLSSKFSKITNYFFLFKLFLPKHKNVIKIRLFGVLIPVNRIIKKKNEP